MTRSGTLNRITDERRLERGEYAQAREEYLREHPVCQLWIAERGLDEAHVLEQMVSRRPGFYYRGERVPFSNQIHHRNKCRKARLTDRRWFMATSHVGHERIEGNKQWARAEGYLLPENADADGRWGDGNQALTTPELMASKVKKEPPVNF